MPYIDKDSKERMEKCLPKNPGIGIYTPGELNYVITKIIIGFLGDNPNYQKYNDAVGALECAKIELYRRRIGDYEDLKIQFNGDVYKENE